MKFQVEIHHIWFKSFRDSKSLSDIGIGKAAATTAKGVASAEGVAESCGAGAKDECRSAIPLNHLEKGVLNMSSCRCGDKLDN